MKKVLVKFCYILIVIAMLTGILTGCAPEQTPPPAEDVALSDTALELAVGATHTLTVSGEIGEIAWSSDAPQIVSVSDGNLTALALGVANVSAMVDEQTLTCRIEVKECPKGQNLLRVNSTVIDYVTKSATISKYQTLPISATLYIDGEIVPSASIALSSTNSEVLEVSGGLLIAKQAGTAKIVAQSSWNGVDYTSAEYTFEVTDTNVLSLSESEITLLEPLNLSGGQNLMANRTKQLKLFVKTASGTESEISANEVEWTVEDSTVATVSNGLITAVANGSTVVKAKYNGNTSKVKVNVAMPIYSADDMDVLGLATYRLSKAEAEKMMAKNYVLMNDIDYSLRARNWIIPIASVNGEFFNTLRAEISINGDISYFSKTWECVLGLSRAKVDSATVLYSLEQEELDLLSDTQKAQYEFKGINPNNLAFSGVFDGNGYSIKNAFLLADNVQYTANKTYATGAQSFIGNLTGTLKNLAFENLYIGDNNLLIDYDSSSEKYLTHVYNKNGSQLYGADNPLALYATYDKDGNGKDLYMKSYNGIVGMRTGRDQWGRRNAYTSALVLKNSGKIENLYASYTNTASECHVISAISIYNVGEISNVVLVPVLDEYNDAACFDMGIGNPVSYKNAGLIQNVAVCHKLTTKQNYSSIFENVGETVAMVTYESFDTLKGESAYSAMFLPAYWDSVEMKLVKNLYSFEE